MKKAHVLAAALAFSALFASPAMAGDAVPSFMISELTTTSGGGYNWDYTVTNITPYYVTPQVYGFVIPEMHSQDLVAQPLFPSGWDVTEHSTDDFLPLKPTIYSGATPGAYLFVNSSEPGEIGIYDGQSVDFNFYSPYQMSTGASFDLAYFYGGTTQQVLVDPPIPFRVASVPEPADLALLAIGALSALALRRRKRG